MYFIYGFSALSICETILGVCHMLSCCIYIHIGPFNCATNVSKKKKKEKKLQQMTQIQLLWLDGNITLFVIMDKERVLNNVKRYLFTKNLGG